MKITFTDEDNDTDIELVIPNDKLRTMDDVSAASMKIARVFAQAIAKQGVLVQQDKKDKPNDSSSS